MWGGNRIHCAISSLLSVDNEVDTLCYEVYGDIIDQYKSALGQGKFYYLKKRATADFYFPYSIKYLYGGLVDYVLYRKIKKFSMSSPYDAILTISSGEGWWLGYFLRKIRKKKGLIVSLHQTDQPLGVDLDYYSGIVNIRHITRLKNTFMIAFQKYRLKYFDVFFGQSTWTNNLMEKYYQIKPIGVAGAIDTEQFFPVRSVCNSTDSYVAVPTASLDSQGIAIITHLKEEGISMIAYGPRTVPGIRNEGYVTDERLKLILGNASVTLFLFDFESLGLIPFESLAMGTPVITEKKLGPGIELESNPYVRFFESEMDILGFIKEFMSRKLTYEDRIKIHKSVEEHSYTEFANRISSVLKTRILEQKR